MNKQETAEAIKVMQAWIDNVWPYHIEFSQPEAPDAWCPVKNNEITWDWASFNYRIKPKEPREGYVRLVDFHAVTEHCGQECIKVREVLSDD